MDDAKKHMDGLTELAGICAIELAPGDHMPMNLLKLLVSPAYFGVTQVFVLDH